MLGSMDPTKLMFFALQDEDIEEDDWFSLATKPASERGKKDPDDLDDDELEF